MASDYQRVFEEAFADVEGGDAIATFSSVTLVGTAVFGLLFGGGLVVLAIFNNRGKNGSRITTWVIGGILLCCGGLGLVSTAAGGMNFSGGGGDPNMPTQQELQDQLNEALPSWFNAANIGLSLLTVLALLGALILLALPPSNEFFRKPQQEWQPPVPGQPGFAAYPAYPPAPGAPAGPPAPSAPPAAPAPQDPPAAPPASTEPPPAPPAPPAPPGGGQPPADPNPPARP